jgi:3-methylcrotonyl-CoA carboxylase alpha subunit
LFKTLLIANRGEISCRVARTAQRLGISAVAVYSDADAGALHTRVADGAVHIGPANARESYLNIGALLRAAQSVGAEAIHPGYGFLSQSPEFAEACEKAGLCFVGPSANAIRLMGVKDQSKSLMHKAGVPVVPGYLGERQDAATLAREADRIGYPLLVKAIAGGGGKGMRVVRTPDELSPSIAAASGEAERAFGDGRIMLERYIEHARHVEVQVIADSHGNTLHLLERDCSLQRRYQKIIEEAPAPGLSGTLRKRLYDAAVAAARAVQYQNAGTVEFVVDGEEFFFLEMNTRLQVEHPVTEAILGLDLVELQLRVAAGEALSIGQGDVKGNGHAFEARLYAEDPRRNFLPTGGRVRELAWPDGVRVDAAVEQGDRVVIDYDALLAKLIVHAPDRGRALNELQRVLASCRIEGVTTNLAALIALAGDAEVREGRVFTRLIDERGEKLLPDLRKQADRAAALAAEALLTEDSSQPTSPWDCKSAGPVRLQPVEGESIVVQATPGNRSDPAIQIDADRVTVWLDGEPHRFDRVSRSADAEADISEGALRAPMPGVVLAVHVKEGDKVIRGEALIVMEAMKMEHTLIATGPGVIADLRVRKGDRVRDGDALLILQKT